MNLDLFWSVFFPPQCLPCGKSLRAGVLCGACRITAAASCSRTFFCGQCRTAVPAPIAADRRFTGSCHPNSPFLLAAATSYDDSPGVKSLIHSLKFQGIRAAADPLAEILGQYSHNLGSPFCGFLVVPIPLSEQRKRTRGFNQSELFAREFAECEGLFFAAAMLLRIRHTKPQTEAATAAERARNIRGCFRVAAPGAAAGRDILLVDDVVTSGATAREASLVLRAAGARTVVVLAAAEAR